MSDTNNKKKITSKVLKTIFALPIVLVFAVSLNAQKLEIGGYFENQLFPQDIKGKVKIMDYNKLRLNLYSDISDMISFSANYIYKTNHGFTELNALDFLPDDLIASYAGAFGVNLDSLRDSFSMKMEDENFLDNAYVSIYTDNFNLRVGKQQLPWGTGYTWNPTDIFHDKNMIDPAYEKIGVNAIKLEIPFSDEGVVTGIVSVNEEWKTSTKAIKVKEVFGDVGCSISFAEKYQEGFDYLTYNSLLEKRRMIGADFSTELLGLGFWAEGAFNIMEDSDNYEQVLIGLDYTFENGFYVTTEYYRNGLGKANKIDYQFNDWMRLLGSQGENLGRDYLFLGQSYPITELLNWSNYSIINLSDGSFMFFPWFNYSLGDNTELNLVGYLPFGEKNTEFGEFGAGGFARIRVYF